jgi:hypothetical protein
MGIQCWQVRCFLPGSKKDLDFSAYALHTAGNKKIGTLCLESQYVPAEYIAALPRLLDAMLAAVQLRRRPLLENHVSPTDQIILIMGELLAQTVPASQANVIATYHPLHLLRNPADKAKAWKDLKKIPPLLSTSL